MIEIDHILWGAPDLDEGARTFEALAGIAPGPGGSHDGLGTRNRLLSLGDGRYFEIIAPDPAQTAHGDRARNLAALPGPGLVAVALRAPDLAAIREAAVKVGIGVRGPVDMSRMRGDGVRLEWSILYLETDEDGFGDDLPFFIDWKTSPHPSGSTAGGCTLERLVVLHPKADRLREIFRAIGIPIEVRKALRYMLMAELATPAGPVTLLGN